MIKKKIYAEYLDHMGSDLSVVDAARTSFHKRSEWISSTLGVPYVEAIRQPNGLFLKEADAKLIKFLASGYRTQEWEDLLETAANTELKSDMSVLLTQHKNKAQHWAPFGHPHIQLHIELPIFLARQFVKHQVGGVWSELSRRYVNDNLEFWFPEEWHTRPEDVKQGSGKPIENQDYSTSVLKRITAQSEAAYITLLAEGVAPEEARMVLSQNLMTTVTWTGSLLFWSRVYNQRSDSHAQLAAQELAHLIDEIIRPLFPVSWRALTE